jgi:hypothetical protein
VDGLRFVHRLLQPLRITSLRTAILQVVGFGLISYALGMWLIPVGIGFAGVSLIVLAALSE